jgi:hypothetical protein
MLKEQSLRRDRRAGLEDEAVTLQAEHRGQRQPFRCQYRPRSHGDNDRIGFQCLTIEQHADDIAVAAQQPFRLAQTQLSALCLGGSHHGDSKCRRIHLRSCGGGANSPGDRDIRRNPSWPGADHRRPAHLASIGRHPAISPVAIERLGKFRMQSEAPAGQTHERRSVAPVEGQEAAGFAGRGAGDGLALKDHHARPSCGEVIGDRCADDARAHNHNSHACSVLVPCGAPPKVTTGRLYVGQTINARSAATGQHVGNELHDTGGSRRTPQLSNWQSAPLRILPNGWLAISW